MSRASSCRRSARRTRSPRRIDAGCKLVICITDGVPVLDMIRVRRFLEGEAGAAHRAELSRRDHPGRVQDRDHAGPHPQEGPHRRPLPLGHADLRGGRPAERPRHRPVELRGHRRRSASAAWTSSTCSSSSTQDPDTHGVVLIGEIGGDGRAARRRWIRKNMKKPVAAFIAGRAAPPGKRMGHAGAIIAGGEGTAAEKIAALEAAGGQGGRHAGRDGHARCRRRWRRRADLPAREGAWRAAGLLCAIFRIARPELPGPGRGARWAGWGPRRTRRDSSPPAKLEERPLGLEHRPIPRPTSTLAPGLPISAFTAPPRIAAHPPPRPTSTLAPGPPISFFSPTPSSGPSPTPPDGTLAPGLPISFFSPPRIAAPPPPPPFYIPRDYRFRC